MRNFSQISQEKDIQNERITVSSVALYAERLGVNVGRMALPGPPAVLE